MAGRADDDGFHEIQLNGKQLVFLFMAATVVSVVIFLTGVLYGRGVRERLTPLPDAGPPSVADVTPQAPPQTPAPPPAGADPTKAPPPQPVDDLSYFNRLEKSNAPDEQLKPQARREPTERAKDKPAPLPPPVKEKPAPAPAKDSTAPLAAPPPSAPKEQPAREAALKEPPPAPATTSGTSRAEPSGQGFALQVAALRERREAESIADRLSSKGYGAYVLASADATPPVFRVRIGKFKTRREAEAVASKLQKEGQFNPWITR